MSKYYFVGSYLPELKIGMPLEISFDDFDRLLRMNLSEHDYEKTKIIRRLWDIENLRSYWKKEPLDPRGNLDEKDIEEALLDGEGVPSYVRHFLDRHESDEQRLQFFPELISAYFREESKNASGFLKQILLFQRELLLTLVAFRAKKIGRSMALELQYEDPEDPFILELMAYKDAPAFEPPEKHENLKSIFEEHSEAPLEFHKALGEYTFDMIDQMVGLQLFTVDRILGYLVQLVLAEKWLELDKAKGTEIVDRFVKEKA